MDTLFCWVETAFSLADVDERSTAGIEAAYLALEKALTIVSDAKAHVEQMLGKTEVSEEELCKARALYSAVRKKVQAKKSHVFILSVQSCVDSLNTINSRGIAPQGFTDECKALREKIIMSKLEDVLGPYHHQIYLQLDTALRQFEREEVHHE